MSQKYPAAVNLQMTYRLRDDVDAIARLCMESRAEIIRQALHEALDLIASRNAITPNRRRITAASIAAERRERGDDARHTST